MEPFKPLDAVAAPLAVANVDTDQIIPARFLWRKRGDGWGHLLFHDLRLDDAGLPRPQFVLNHPQYRAARILVADHNFACGSSREHAVWALYDYGIRSVIAPSFGDIFFNNCLQNGLLPVRLPTEAVEGLFAALQHSPGAHLGVDLEAQCVSGVDGVMHAFEIDPFRKQCLLEGTDEVLFTLGLTEQIEAFETAYERKVSWL
jgi:3-isopropylmalate/(R)-2-methylmalate dehydratase small subunit